MNDSIGYNVAMRSLADINLAQRDREAVSLAAGRVRERFPIDRVILFGSKVRGDDDEDSDIDLLVLTSQPCSRELKDQIQRVLYDLQCDLDVQFGKLVLSAEEWDHGLYQAAPIHAEIAEEGVAL